MGGETWSTSPELGGYNVQCDRVQCTPPQSPQFRRHCCLSVGRWCIELWGITSCASCSLMSPHASVHARDRPIKALKAAMQTTCIAMVVRLASRSSHCMLPCTIRYDAIRDDIQQLFRYVQQPSADYSPCPCAGAMRRRRRRRNFWSATAQIGGAADNATVAERQSVNIFVEIPTSAQGSTSCTYMRCIFHQQRS